ncbi:DUF6886 family protein [Paenibacillus xylanexedens]|uniref:DUF6886 family protein n=1 Tax=Paenibacillus xylanexedens TaxID=528191 RepID=UPI0011A66AE1|nr:DUF6886 family protein [Paenibacillus xylanexedens]
MKLYHFSEESEITIFEPRTIYNQTDAKVWTIDAYHAAHYFFPRDCPRVCIWSKEDAGQLNLAQEFGVTSTKRMIAIESDWYDRVREGHIYRYTFESEHFELENEDAGYYTSKCTVRPIAVERMNDLIGAILKEDIEFRVMPSLMPLKQKVLESNIQFSMIRMRNAKE